MIVYRQWQKKMRPSSSMPNYWTYEGWFLLGMLPLYVRRIGVK